MLHFMKYQFLQTVRERMSMFWALFFPIILGTLFFISFGSGNMGQEMEPLPVGMVVRGGESAESGAFEAFLKELDGEVIRLQEMEEEEGLSALESDEAEGIFYVGEEPELVVAKSGLEQSILKTVLDIYRKNAEILRVVSERHPESLDTALENLEGWESMTEEVSVGGKTLDPNVSYFFALIAYSALSGIYLGIKGCCDSQGNLSPLGARKCITPVPRIKRLLCSFLVWFFIQFINTMVLTLYIRFVLGVDLGGDPASVILINLMGSMIGVSGGILIGSVGRMKFDMKLSLGVLFTLLPGFLAGLMFGDMKNIIEQHCPIINRINPAAVLADSYYCMAVYNDAERMSRNLLILAAMSALFVLAAFAVTRREAYDSI